MLKPKLKLIAVFILMILAYSQGHCENKANEINMSGLKDYRLRESKDEDDFKGIYIKTDGWQLDDIHNKLYDIWPTIIELEKLDLINGFHFIHHSKINVGNCIEIRFSTNNWNENENKIENILKNNHLAFELGGGEKLKTTKKVLDHNVLEFNSNLIIDFIKYQRKRQMPNNEKLEMMEQCFRKWTYDLYTQYKLDDFDKAKHHFNLFIKQRDGNNMVRKIDDFRRGRINKPAAKNIDIQQLDHKVHKFYNDLIVTFIDYKKIMMDNMYMNKDDIKKNPEKGQIKEEIERIFEDYFGVSRGKDWFAQWICADVDKKYQIMEQYVGQPIVRRWFRDWDQLDNIEKHKKMEERFEQIISQSCLEYWVHYLYIQYGIDNFKESNYRFKNSHIWLETYFFNHPENIDRINSFFD